MYRHMPTLAILLLFTVPLSYAQQIASLDEVRQFNGVLPDVIEKGIYVVTGDVFVSPGSTVSVQAGTVFLFKEFTGIHVQGSLYVIGTESEPIVFTSANDSSYLRNASVKAAPFDWNGIDVYDGAIGTTLNNCRIQYSVYGIRSQTEYVKLENVRFSSNGKSDFSIKEERKEVTDPYNYIYEPAPVIPVAPTAVSSVSEQNPESVQKSKPSLGIESPSPQKNGNRGVRAFFRVTGIMLALGGGGLGAYFGDQYLNSQDHYKDISHLDNEEMRLYTSEDWKNAKEKRDQDFLKTVICGGVGILGLTSFVISFAF
ncbi:MAG TPA: hypothetical protein VHO70_14715 [Chitinispirillaceae bacterium]|nr:hypothetical protein [Chitinispirillaceae bacterium]